MADALSRIAASQVARIDVVRNALTAEARGQTLVINVIRAKRTPSGTWSAEAERKSIGVIYPRVEARCAREVGGWETSTRVGGFWKEFPFRLAPLLATAKTRGLPS